MKAGFWKDKRVFLTGHTGFKGGWLAIWLQQAGARVHGYALAPPTSTNLFGVGKVSDGMASNVIADIRDERAVKAAITAASPDVVFHLAAQPLVRYSYAAPIETYSVNVLGTAHLLEAVRSCPSVQVVVSVTTDKCYENKEWLWGYRESESLGGRDPYSSSKACAELVTASYRDSFLASAGVRVASARAGNVIGGGDWAADRLIPDFFRAALDGRPLAVRSPGSTRPWQHVLEPLAGYLALAEALWDGNGNYAEAWNFGPAEEDARPVGWLLDRLVRNMRGTSWEHVGGENVHEAGYLKLDSSKARARLGWQPRWNLETALVKTVEWHEAWRAGADMRSVCTEQIVAYQQNQGARKDVTL